MNSRPFNREQLAALLREAETAHGEYERSLGRRDDNWPEWYADFIFRRLDPRQFPPGVAVPDDAIPSVEPYLDQ